MQPHTLNDCPCNGTCQNCSTLSGVDVETLRQIAEQEATAQMTLDNLAMVATGDMTPIITVAENTAKRACEQGVLSEVKSKWHIIATGALALVGIGYVLGSNK